MFDLPKSILKSAIASDKDDLTKSYTCFYQTSECLELMQQVFRFEGWTSPNFIKLDDSALDLTAINDIVILELNESKNVVEDARHFAARLPNQKSLIVIGQENSISTMRELKESGFYYVFWPLSQKELSEFLRHVNFSSQSSGVNKNRKAKRIAVIGSKGGVGNTMVTCELASTLASRYVDTIQVDHQYFNSNTDILLSLVKFERQDADGLTAQLNDMDDESASGYLKEVDKHWRLLAFTGSDDAATLYGNTEQINKLLSRQANFIIEDFSSSTDFVIDPEVLCNWIDIFVVVLDATVSSVRNAAKVIEKIDLHNASAQTEVRIFTLLNMHRPEAAFPLKKDEVERYLDREIDVQLGYMPNSAALMLEGKRLSALEKGSGCFNNLAELIQGKQVKTNKSLWDKLKGRA